MPTGSLNSKPSCVRMFNFGSMGAFGVYDHHAGAGAVHEGVPGYKRGLLT